jgi:hypothetical protein
MDAYTGMAERLLLEDPPTEESERDFAVADALLRAVELSVLLSHDGTAQLCQTAADVACEFSRVGSTAAALEILEPLLSHDRTRGLLRLSPVSAAIGGAVQSHAAEAGQEHRHFERRWMALCARVDRAKTDPDAERNLMTAIAASFEREGDTILATREHANLIAADAYGSAIEALKQIPDTRSEVDRLQVKLDQCGEAAREDVGTIVHRIELDPDQVTAAKAQLEAAVSQYGLRALGDRFFMPQISEMRRAADEALKTTPLLARIQHVTFGGGRLLGRDSTYEERVEWYAMTSVLRALLCTASQVVPWAVDFLRVGGALTGAAMAQALDGADLIAEWRRDLIVHAFQRYIEGDYVSAVHIWVFQIEGVLRDTACRLGRPAMRTDKEGLTRARDLGNLLRDPAVVDLLGEDRVASLKAVLCERDVMNLRNEIAHGLATPEAFTRDVANLVLLLVLSFTPFQAQGGDADDQPAPPPE